MLLSGTNTLTNPETAGIEHYYDNGTSNQLAPFSAFSNQLSQSGHPTALVYNTGQLYVDPNSSRHVAIYNAPGGQVHIAGNGAGGGGIICDYCGESFSTQAQRAEHGINLKYACRQHGMCFSSWRTHVNGYSHTMCPIPSCAKAGVDFGSDARFEQHFRNKH